MSTLESDRKKIKEELMWAHDGPITQYILICRAMEIARLGSYTLYGIYDPVAEALDEVLTELEDD